MRPQNTWRRGYETELKKIGKTRQRQKATSTDRKRWNDRKWWKDRKRHRMKSHLSVD